MDRRAFFASIGLGTIATFLGNKELVVPLKLDEEKIEVFVNLRSGIKSIYKDEFSNIIESHGLVEYDLGDALSNLINMHIYRMGHAPKYIYVDGFVKFKDSDIGWLEFSIVYGAVSSDKTLEYLYSESEI